MKTDKLCFSKVFAVIFPIILVLLGVVLFTNYLNKQKLATNSRAATPNVCYFEGKKFVPNVSQNIGTQKFMYDTLSRCMKQGPKDAQDSTLINIGVICNEDTGVAQMDEINCKVPLDSPVWVLGNPEASTKIPAEICIFDKQPLYRIIPSIHDKKKYVLGFDDCIKVKYASDSNDVPYSNHLGYLCNESTGYVPKISSACPLAQSPYTGYYMPAPTKKECKIENFNNDGKDEVLQVGKISTPAIVKGPDHVDYGNGFTYSIDLNGCIIQNENQPGSYWHPAGGICNAETNWEYEQILMGSSRKALLLCPIIMADGKVYLFDHYLPE